MAIPGTNSSFAQTRRISRTRKITMTITISIDDSAAKDILQNIALAKAMTDVSDDEVRTRLGQDIAKDIVNLTKQGQQIRKRNEEQAEIAAAVAKISVT